MISLQGAYIYFQMKKLVQKIRSYILVLSCAMHIGTYTLTSRYISAIIRISSRECVNAKFVSNDPLTPSLPTPPPPPPSPTRLLLPMNRVRTVIVSIAFFAATRSLPTSTSKYE